MGKYKHKRYVNVTFAVLNEYLVQKWGMTKAMHLTNNNNHPITIISDLISIENYSPRVGQAGKLAAGWLASLLLERTRSLPDPFLGKTKG